MFASKKKLTQQWLMNQLGSSTDIVHKEIQSNHSKALILYIKSF